MQRTRKPWSAEQYGRGSAICLIFALILIAFVGGSGDGRGAAAMFFTFVLGLLCASYGARSRAAALPATASTEKVTIKASIGTDVVIKDALERMRKAQLDRNNRNKKL